MAVKMADLRKTRFFEKKKCAKRTHLDGQKMQLFICKS